VSLLRFRIKCGIWDLGLFHLNPKTIIAAIWSNPRQCQFVAKQLMMKAFSPSKKPVAPSSAGRSSPALSLQQQQQQQQQQQVPRTVPRIGHLSPVATDVSKKWEWTTAPIVSNSESLKTTVCKATSTQNYYSKNASSRESWTSSGTPQ
jgi:hypothetical protein